MMICGRGRHKIHILLYSYMVNRHVIASKFQNPLFCRLGVGFRKSGFVDLSWLCGCFRIWTRLALDRLILQKKICFLSWPRPADCCVKLCKPWFVGLVIRVISQVSLNLGILQPKVKKICNSWCLIKINLNFSYFILTALTAVPILLILSVIYISWIKGVFHSWVSTYNLVLKHRTTESPE